ncbi:MAG: hypothetical protein ACHBN1_00625 [Heteroscytonema crispum UTEX LB 1556]
MCCQIQAVDTYIQKKVITYGFNGCCIADADKHFCLRCVSQTAVDNSGF